MHDLFFKKLVWVGLTTIALSGCADMNTQFDCPLKPGIHCENLDQVNARVTRGEWRKKTQPSSHTTKTHVKRNEFAFNEMFQSNQKKPIFIASYIDSEGKYQGEKWLDADLETKAWMRA